jgi:putative ferrous iron transport protein C
MSLVDLKQYLMKVRIASMSSISVYFNTEPDTLRHMLSHWVRKGCVRQCLKTPNCGSSCGKCSPLLTEIYEWVAV